MGEILVYVHVYYANLLSVGLSAQRVLDLHNIVFSLARMQKNNQYQIFIHTREYLFEYFCYICKVSEILIAEIMLTFHLNNSA